MQKKDKAMAKIDGVLSSVKSPMRKHVDTQTSMAVNHNMLRVRFDMMREIGSAVVRPVRNTLEHRPA